MRGSTRKRGSSWTAYWDIVDPLTGKRTQRSKGGFATRKAAQGHLDTVVPASKAGVYTEPSKLTLAAFAVNEWLPARADALKPLTYERYERVLRGHVAKRPIGAVALCNVSPGHVNALYAELKAEGLAASTRRLSHAVLNRAMRDAVRWGKITRNPVPLADPPAVPSSSAKAWSERELASLLAHVAEDRLFALWRLAAMTGARRGELLGASWRALDLDGARLKIEGQVIPLTGPCAICGQTHSCSFGTVKRKRSQRTISLDAQTVAALREHRACQQLERDLAGGAYVDHDLCFADELGGPIRPQRATALCTAHRKAAGLGWGSMHTLRHTHATHLLSAGVPLHVAAARLGDDPKVLLSVYAHLLEHSDEQAAQVAADLIDRALTKAQAPAPVAAL
jgi:integrase